MSTSESVPVDNRNVKCMNGVAPGSAQLFTHAARVR